MRVEVAKPLGLLVAEVNPITDSELDKEARDAVDWAEKEEIESLECELTLLELEDTVILELDKVFAIIKLHQQAER